MSTKSSIKWREQTDTAPGFHLYDDALDDGNPPPVYLRIDGVEADLSTTAGGATVTLTLPREVAQALGLLSADQSGEDAANGAPSDTGNAEADRIINRLSSSDPEFDDCIDAVAFIRKLVAEHKGPEGFATWNDAAVWERQRRLAAEKSLRDTSKELICAVAEQSVDQVDDNGAIGEREAHCVNTCNFYNKNRPCECPAPQSDATSWEALFDRVALELNCLPSSSVDGNEHVFQAIAKLRAALTAEKVAAEPTNIPFSAYRLKVAEECCERLMSACTDSGCPDGVNMADWIRQLAASPQATATLSDAALRKLVIGVREFILGYLHSHVKDWPAPYDHLRSDAVTESLVTDARDQIATATQPAQVALSDADMLALIRKVEDKLGIVWFVPDDSGRCLWRTTDTEERNKFVRTLLSMHSAPTNAIGDAARDVIVERQRQMSAEGWTPEHDDEHEIGELARAAACYAANATGFRLQSRLNIWPWDREWWKPTTPRRDLIKAGALILAEIERIDRAAVQPAGGTDHE